MYKTGLVTNKTLLISAFSAYDHLNNSEQSKRNNDITNIKNIGKLNFQVHAHFFDSFIQVKVERLVTALKNSGKNKNKIFFLTRV